jgi:C4-dicarboxylate-specific signal transduction histidine kinase
VSGQYLVSVGIPARAARDRTFPIYRRNVSWAIGVISVILIIAIIVARRWLQAVTHLESAAVRVSSGDLADPHRTPMPSREFEQLQQTFADMVARLRDARDLAAARVVEERRMREEVQLLQRQVVRQERLAAIGVLVSGIAHELNNPLQGIYGLAELLRRRDDLSAEARADVDLIERESARAAAIISNLSRFGRQQSAQPVEVALGDIVGSVMELRDRKLAEADIDVVIDNQAHQRVRAVFTELQQVLLNFVINAEQAMAGTAGARRITIRTSEVRHGVRLEVEDTGPGVAQEDESRLFQPFFSTKPVGEGTGLGLSVSYGIIHGYGGSVGYERGAAGGALFWLELPITEAQGAS